ncbi:MAG: hypothetical protein E7414_05220 [Ruminococcaceae bacterium]|nr:hypothetical protein [Oscillospiraceae bacterium]
MEKVRSLTEILYQKISMHQKEAVKWLCFSLGICFAFLFPKTAKKLRSFLLLFSLLAMIPSFCRLLAELGRDIKRLTTA